MNGERAEPAAPLAFRYADLPCATEIAALIPAIRHTYRARRDLMRLWATLHLE